LLERFPCAYEAPLLPDVERSAARMWSSRRYGIREGHAAAFNKRNLSNSADIEKHGAPETVSHARGVVPVRSANVAEM